MRLRSANLVLIGVIVVFFSFVTMTRDSRAEDPMAEPSLETILNTLGYTNIALSSAQTFPAGAYEARLLAEFGAYCDTNDFSHYPVGTSDFILLFSGPQGNYGYVSPPVSASLSSTTTFGCSMYVAEEDHRYFTQTSRNPDGRQHAKVYRNLDVPGMYFIGFENIYGWGGDRDFQDMVVSICPSVEYYLAVQTQPLGVTTILGQGWYPYGADAVLTAPLTVPISTSSRYSFSYWDVDGASQGAGQNPVTVNMAANRTATAHYTLQYYLTVVSSHGLPGGEGWYDSGVTAYATLDTGIVDHGNGTRRVFTSWGGDASGADYGQSNPMLMDGPNVAVANWKTQYLLTVTCTLGGVIDPAGSEWYDTGTTLSVTAVPDVDYVLDHWELDGSPVGSTNPCGVLMTSAHTLHAVFEYSPATPTEYYLTVKTDPLGITSIPGEDWYLADEDVTLTTPEFSAVSEGTRYSFSYWDVDGASQGTGVNPITVTMNANHTVTAHYTLQYYLTVSSPYGTVGNEGWYDSESTAYSTLDIGVLDHGNGTRRIFTHWNGDATGTVYAQGDPILMNGPKTAIAAWKTQYHLTVKTNPSGVATIPGEDWYDASANVPLTAPTVSGYSFQHWEIGSVSQGSGVQSIIVVMTGPRTATANYSPIAVGGSTRSIEPDLAYPWPTIIFMLAAAFGAAMLYVKKRRKTI